MVSSLFVRFRRVSSGSSTPPAQALPALQRPNLNVRTLPAVLTRSCHLARSWRFCRLPLWLVGAVLVVSTGCQSDLIGLDPPLDQPVFPRGLAVHPTLNTLAVVSTNFELEFNRGGLLLVDLADIDAKLSTVTNPRAPTAALQGAYFGGAYLPSFGQSPVFSQSGDRLLVATQGGNRIAEVEVDTSGAQPRLSCSAAAQDIPNCGLAPRALQLPGNDPYDIVIRSEAPDRLSAVASAIGDNEVFFFQVVPSDDTERRMQLTDTLFLGTNVKGVRGLAMREQNGERTLFATVDIDNGGGSHAELYWFDADAGGQAEIFSLDLSAQVGAARARALTLTPDGNGLLVVLRGPDGLLRIDLSGTGPNAARIGGVVGTCRTPTRLTYAQIPKVDGSIVDRVFLTCFDADSVVGYDPVSLLQTDAVRFFGNGPFEMAVRTDNRGEPRAYVSYFLDDTIGVFSLLNAAGEVELSPLGRIGVPHVHPGDAR